MDEIRPSISSSWRYFLSGPIANFTVAGHRQGLSGNQAVSRRPTADLFRTGDGYVLFAVNTEKQYRALMNALGLENSLTDPRFIDWDARTKNAPALRASIAVNARDNTEPQQHALHGLQPSEVGLREAHTDALFLMPLNATVGVEESAQKSAAKTAGGALHRPSAVSQSGSRSVIKRTRRL